MIHNRCRAEQSPPNKCQKLINTEVDLIPGPAWVLIFAMLAMTIIISVLAWLLIIKMIWMVAVVFQQIGVLGNWLSHHVCGCRSK